jgi:plasmid stability protein
MMATLTIRNIDDAVKDRLRVRAARNGNSMEEEARVILKRAVQGLTGPEVRELSRRLFEGEKGVELDLPDREDDRLPPDFGADETVDP